mmetsp:Transcript_51631/g.167711  ORF Transcript_51631/g.167711 Transcript_51631/m.167711 type:complete len:267 (+) Transcript_51631:1808-2608(+)
MHEDPLRPWRRHPRQQVLYKPLTPAVPRGGAGHERPRRDPVVQRACQSAEGRQQRPQRLHPFSKGPSVVGARHLDGLERPRDDSTHHQPCLVGLVVAEKQQTLLQQQALCWLGDAAGLRPRPVAGCQHRRAPRGRQRLKRRGRRRGVDRRRGLRTEPGLDQELAGRGAGQARLRFKVAPQHQHDEALEAPQAAMRQPRKPEGVEASVVYVGDVHWKKRSWQDVARFLSRHHDQREHFRTDKGQEQGADVGIEVSRQTAQCEGQKCR